MSKTKLLMGASVLAAASLGLASAASASITDIYGGGGSLIAPTMRLGGDCYGVATALVIRGTAGGGTYHNPTLQTFAPFVDANYSCVPGSLTKPQPKTTVRINYLSSGSGGGLATFFQHNTVPYWGDATSTFNSPYPDVHFGESDAALSAADVAYYNTGTKGTSSIAGVVPTGGNPQFYGNVIQVPLLVTPVTLAFDPIYKKVADASGNVTAYKFNIQNPAITDGSGGLILDRSTMCGIVNGQITSWSDPALTALNGGVSLKDPSDPGSEFDTLAITLTGRSDSSGTTSIFTRAMAAQCAGFAYNHFTNGATTILAASDATENGLWTLVANSAGVATALSFTASPAPGTTLVHGNLGYEGPDYVWPANQVTLANQFPAGTAYHLDTVALINGSGGGPLEPSPKNTLTAFNTASPAPPQSDSKGNYVASNTAHGLRSDPTAWAESPDKGQPLANPSAGYPIVGTTHALFYTCYANKTVETNVVNWFDFLFADKRWIGSPTTTGVLSAVGFVPLPAAWNAAIVKTFIHPVTVTGSANTAVLNLNVLTAGTAGNTTTGVGTQCASATGA